MTRRGKSSPASPGQVECDEKALVRVLVLLLLRWGDWERRKTTRKVQLQLSRYLVLDWLGDADGDHEVSSHRGADSVRGDGQRPLLQQQQEKAASYHSPP